MTSAFPILMFVVIVCAVGGALIMFGFDLVMRLQFTPPSRAGDAAALRLPPPWQRPLGLAAFSAGAIVMISAAIMTTLAGAPGELAVPDAAVSFYGAQFAGLIAGAVAARLALQAGLSGRLHVGDHLPIDVFPPDIDRRSEPAN
ncbi:MAG: hypothetical protein JNL66_07260 [Alphaproteobacteria bacterium]|nr:hypothetical protein [Alphaproteobacteria bacterium]